MPSISTRRVYRPTFTVLLLLLAHAGGAAEPLPGEARITIEARVTPAQVVAPESTIALCLQNVNRRTGTGQALLSGDTWVFRVDPACGAFRPVAGCPGDLMVAASSLDVADFGCSVTPTSVALTYTGAPRLLAFEEQVCLSAWFAPRSGSCSVEYRFSPRTTALGSYAAEGMGRINQTQSPSFFPVLTASAGPGGASGAPGAPGPPGPVGATGEMGPAGPAGATGVAGSAGAPGPAGATGVAGNNGAPGQAGDTGAVGPVGGTGATGAAGGAGAVGATGATGPAGVDGNNGAVGGTGATGVAGSNGAVGATGSTGPAGVDGNNGAVGGTGATGAAGSNGAVGATGSTGPAGADGNNGAVGGTGATGAAGGNGAVGATGSTGPAGADGNNGAVGGTGATGVAGGNGAVGATGSTGPAGVDGNNGAVGGTGATGVAGPAGDDGSVGATGSTGATGVAGSNGAVGGTGATGATGAGGDTGATGATGSGTTGATGATGSSGATGATGATGPYPFATAVDGAGDASTTSASFVVMPNMTITRTITGTQVLCLFSATVEHSIDDRESNYAIFVDGTEKFRTRRELQTKHNSTVIGESTITYLVRGLTPGSHTFDVRWRTVTGDYSILQRATLGAGRTFTIIEY